MPVIARSTRAVAVASTLGINLFTAERLPSIRPGQDEGYWDMQQKRAAGRRLFQRVRNPLCGNGMSLFA